MLPERPAHRTRAIIDLDRLAANFKASKAFIGPELKYMAVVKANAYGHGAVECSRRLEAEGADWFGVAIPQEGVELRQAGISKPILILGSFRPGDQATIVDHSLTPVIFDLQTAAALSDHLGTRSYDIHLKIDTGMGRLGVRWPEVGEFANEIARFSNLRVTALMTHFASADDPEQFAFTELQIERFHRAVGCFRELGFDPEIVDMANSPGGIAHPNSRVGMVRLGGALYGLLDDIVPAEVASPHLEPVMSVVSCLADIKNVPAGEGLGYGQTFRTERDSRIALVPFGYADGYRRLLSNRAHMIVRNKLAPVVGRVSMDWTIIDVTDVEGAEPGDEVILIGRSEDQEVTAADLAGKAGTIGYEVTCGISQRVPRVYR